MAASFCTKLFQRMKLFNSVAFLDALAPERVIDRLEMDIIEVKLK